MNPDSCKQYSMYISNNHLYLWQCLIHSLKIFSLYFLFCFYCVINNDIICDDSATECNAICNCIRQYICREREREKRKEIIYTDKHHKFEECSNDCIRKVAHIQNKNNKNAPIHKDK